MANEDAGRRRLPATEDQERARAVGARKPGVIAGAVERCHEAAGAIRCPRLDWRTFFWGLLLLILIILIVQNWAPVRINLLGWYLDAPKAVVFAIYFLLGMLATWLIETYSHRARVAAREARAEALAGATGARYAEEDLSDEDLLDDEEIIRDEPAPVEEPAPEVHEEVHPTPEEIAERPAFAVPAAEPSTVEAEDVEFEEPADPEALRTLDDDLDADIELGNDEVAPADDEGESKPFWRL